jgi:hypothetical protein
MNFIYSKDETKCLAKTDADFTISGITDDGIGAPFF